MRALSIIVFRDVRRILVPLAVVLVLAVLSMWMASGVARDVAEGAGARSGISEAGLVWWLVRALLILVAADIVLADPVGGSYAFWRTRPIHPEVILIAKVLVLGAPAITLGVSAFFTGLVAEQTLHGAVLEASYRVLDAGMWLSISAALASLAASHRQFMLHAGCALIGSAAAVAGFVFAAQQDERIAWHVANEAVNGGVVWATASGGAQILALLALGGRYLNPHRHRLAMLLAWTASLIVLGLEALRLAA